MRLFVLVFAGVFLLNALDVRPVEAKRRRRRAFGTLHVNSGTTGAKVYVDGREMGAIPLEKPLRLKVGRHTLKVAKTGYTPYIDVILIKRRKAAKVDIDLLPVAGVLAVTASVPEARVYVDGRFVGLAPLTTEVQEGKHSIRVQKAGYHDFIATQKALPGAKLRLKATLKAMAVGTTPYRPAPPPPPRWYEKWYVWAGVAGGAIAVALAVAIPVAVASGDPVSDFGADHSFTIR
ncbi:MAG: PEGA domain-containing protein [Deltaproteobacteria bacterium]|nr:PEGA domain-containing protein [Deltaproteobacteria bacterium]